MGSALLYLFDAVINLTLVVLLVYAISTWLVAFGVLNIRNPTIYKIMSAFEAITDPLLRPLRRIIPPLGGLDLSFIALWLLLSALKILVHNTIAGPLVAALG